MLGLNDYFILLGERVQPKYSYTYHKEKKTVLEASFTCEAEGGRLLHMNSLEEMDHVTSSSDMDPSKGWWLGLFRPDSVSTAWKWSDDSKPAWPLPWDDGEPDSNKTSLCVRIAYVGDAWKLKLYACDKELWFICKLDAEGKSAFMLMVKYFIRIKSF